MNLEAEITRVQLNSLPPSIVKRMLRRNDVVELAQAGSAEVSEIGQLYFADVRTTLATVDLDIDIELPARQGVNRVSIIRSADGRCRVREKSGRETLLLELSLLDPSAEVRLNGLRHLVQRALPCWPRSANWERIVADRPLNDSEFGLVLDELQGLADPVLDGVAAALGSGQFKALDVIPTGVTYYESLLGEIPATTEASQYVEGTLNPHLQRVFQNDTSWGLRCVRAACISELVNPVGSAIAVSNDLLLSAIEKFGFGVTPFATLATYKLATARAAHDERFSTIANNALDQLIQRTLYNGIELDVEALYLALMRLTLSVIGQAEELFSASPFWKRLAAFTHASMLVEMIDFSGADVGDLVKWCDSRRTPDTGAVETLDHLREPMWRVDAQSSDDLWSASLIRAVKWTPSGIEPSINLALDQKSQLEQLHPKLILVAGVPDPLSGTRRDRTAVGIQLMDESLLDSFVSSSTGVQSISSKVWNALAYSSRIYAFTDGLILRIRDMAKQLKIDESREIKDIYSNLAWCCDIASTQTDLELAGIAVDCILEASEELTDPLDVIKAVAIVIMASGAAHDPKSSLQWAADRLLELAYQLPRGECCEKFVQIISTVQKFIPLEHRRWGKAIATAKSAIL